jgi:uroporphyrinogen-III synthase
MTTTPRLAGRRVGITADRRWRVQADLLEQLGADVVHGPTLRTVDLRHDGALQRATLSLVAAPPDYLVAGTGQGMSLWLEAAGAWGMGDGLLAALGSAVIVARGAKAHSALRRAGLAVAWQAPSETMEDVVAHLAAEGIGSARVAVQLFDPAGHPSTAALAARCRELVEVPVYRWAMPDDPGPAVALIDAACAGELDALTFTSQPAVRHLFRLADQRGRGAELRAACNAAVRAVCVGPVCADAAVAEGVTRPVWPEPPRLAAMVRLVAAELGPGRRAGRPGPSCRGGGSAVDSERLLDARTRTMTGPAGAVELTDLQFALVAAMVRRPGMTCPTGVLLREVWGAGASPTGAARRRLEVLGSRLRSRLATIGVKVVSLPKRGYRLELAGLSTAASSVSPEAPPVG